MNGKEATLVPVRLRLDARRGLRGRSVAVAVLVAGGLVAAYVVARQTSLFAVRAVEVTGAPPTVVRDVERASASVRGTSLVALDRGALERRLLALPSVVAVRVDRAFPSRLKLQVVPEHPAAVVRAGRRAWVVSRRGRVVESVGIGALSKLPRIWLPSKIDLTPGTTINRDEQALALSALVLVAPGFPAKVASARDESGDIVFVLRDGLELRLGPRDELRLKLRVAGRILTTLSPAEQATLDYLDVGTPERVVARGKAQVESPG